MQKHFYFLCAILVSLMLAISACNLAAGSPTATPSPIARRDTPTATSTTVITAAATHTMIPGNVPGSISIANDTNSQLSADQHYATAGDLYDLNRFERPFTQDGMVYLPALDIQELGISKDPNWYYATLQLAGVDTTANSLNANYGLEIDLNKDGRGDILIWARPPYTSDWSTTPVTVYADTNGDVGAANPLKSDAPATGDGYETVIFADGQGTDPDLAWVRLAPDSSNNIEFAFKPSLLNGTSAFLIGGWADIGLRDPSKFNYNDRFSLAEAGSALHGDADYPIKAVYALDSTCRAAVGFTPSGSEPLVCPLPATPIPNNVSPGGIRGVVYIDNNGNGIQEAGEAGSNAYPLYLFAGTCTGSSINSTTPDSNGNYSFPNLSAGNYCIDLFYSGSPVLPSNPQIAGVSEGNTTTINFGIVPPP